MRVYKHALIQYLKKMVLNMASQLLHQMREQIG